MITVLDELLCSFTKSKNETFNDEYRKEKNDSKEVFWGTQKESLNTLLTDTQTKIIKHFSHPNLNKEIKDEVAKITCNTVTEAEKK